MTTETAPLTDAETRRAWRAFAVGSASIFMFVLDAGLLSVALPEIERAFPNSSRATVSWVSTGYLVAVAGLMLVAGRLGDVLGRRRVFRTGLLVLAFTSFLTAVSPAIGILIVARMIQGVGAALVTATGLTLVLADLPVKRQPLAIGIWGSVGSLAAVLGPTVGAELLDLTSWRWTLGLIAPISLITWVAGRAVLREATDPRAPDRISVTPVIFATAGIGGVALGLSQSRVWGWGDGRTIASLALGAVAFGAFVEHCRRDREPLLELSLFHNRSFSGASLAAGLQQLGFFSWFFSTSFVLREIWGWSVRDTGQAISLTFICSTLTGWLSGRASARYGYFWPTAIGAVIAAAGPTYWFFAFEADPSFWRVYLPGSVLFGLGGGACGVLTTGMALRTVGPEDQGMAYAAHQTMRRMASATGLALMATLLGEASGAELLGGGRNVWLMSAAAHIVMVLPVLGERRSSP